MEDAVACRILDISEFENTARPVPVKSAAKPAAHVYQFPSPGQAPPRHSDVLACARGARLGIALEMAAGLLIYGFWEGWHLIHLWANPHLPH